MKGIEFDTSKTSFNAVLRDWQLKTMHVVWSNTEGIKSRMVWLKVNQVLRDETISRASVINFLEDMREWGVLRGEERTGKGGNHWVYFPALDEAGFKGFIAETLITSLLKSFPDETREAIRKQVT